MRSFKELKHLPQFSGIYAFKGINDRSGMYSYIGMASQLRDRVSQHLIRRDSSVTTGASTVVLNPDKISECHWWVHDSFNDKIYLEAAELIAFNKFNPTLTSRGTVSNQAKVISSETKFKDEMDLLFDNIPSGYAVFYDLEWAIEKIKELEKEIEILKAK